MSLPAGNRDIRDNNRVPLLYAVSYLNSNVGVQVTADPATGAILTSSVGSALPTTVIAGQQAVTATAAALPSSALTNGVIVTGLSTNAISVFVGPVGVLTTTGAELQPGAALSAAVANTSDLYVVASTTGATVTWLGS